MPENVDLDDFYRYASYASRTETASPQYRPSMTSNDGPSRNSNFENSFQSFSISENSTPTSPRNLISSQESSIVESRRLGTHSEVNQANPYRSVRSPESSASAQFPVQENAISQRNSIVVENSWPGSPSNEQPRQQGTTQSDSYKNDAAFRRRPVLSQTRSEPPPPQLITSSSPSIANPPTNNAELVGRRLNPGGTYEWKLSCDLFHPVFKEWSGDLGVVTGEKARQLFEKSQLSPSTLGSIWHYADAGNKGFLLSLEFMIAMHLIRACRRGLESELLNARDAAALKTQLEKFAEENTRAKLNALLGFNDQGAKKLDRFQYDLECLQKLFPKPEEEIERRKKIVRATKLPADQNPFPINSNRSSVDPFGLDSPRNSLFVDDFDDNDIDDEEDLVIHRINYTRDQFFSFLQQKKYAEAYEELDACALQANFLFRFTLMKAIIENIALANWGTTSNDALAKLAYSAPEGVLANLLVYFNRALNNFGYGSEQLAIQDCKRGLKLAKTAGITEADRLETWTKSDLADLAAIISLHSGARADAQYYQNMIQTDHEIHTSLRDSRELAGNRSLVPVDPLRHNPVNSTPAVSATAGGSSGTRYHRPSTNRRDLFEAFD
ncbi:hypothetical protein AA313_de0206385 [Arthrobotrys entomopaga]|nr:hypothetical protein AA313_de0206385 [Arthrobotrys entomopaga]